MLTYDSVQYNEDDNDDDDDKLENIIFAQWVE